MFKTLFLVLISTALINNVVLSQFLGICPFLGVSRSVKTAAGMGGAVIFVITISSAVTNLLYTGIIQKLGLDYLKTIVFILVIAAIVQFIEMFLKNLCRSFIRLSACICRLSPQTAQCSAFRSPMCRTVIISSPPF